MTSTELLLLVCLASTWFMTGLIWFVQIVHYPLFGRVEPLAFARYHAAHTRRTGHVVLVPMILELATSALLVVHRPEGVQTGLVWAGLAAALLVWASTAFVQIPLHRKLASGFDPAAHRMLVWTNAFRTLIWSLHALIVLIMTTQAIPDGKIG